jgi:sporulation protein YlmC with PRC-barrel domain
MDSMMRWVRRHDVTGHEVVDREGAFIGTVADTFPLDGGGEIELLLVNVGRRFPRRRYVPADRISVKDGVVRLPVLRVDVDDCPSAEDRRWGSPRDIARSYWVSAGG